MKEWNNPYNPFNSFKVLLWRKHLEACAKDNYLVPISVDINLSNRCNFQCVHCNAWDLISQGEKDLPTEHWLKVADFLRDWGKDKPEGSPKSACVAGGGGETFMHPGIMAFLERMYQNGLESGVITNGSLLDDKKINVIARVCRWVGFSMDAATPQTFNAIKGIKNDSLFNKICKDIKKLTTRIDEKGYINDVAYKFLLCPENAGEIYAAVKLAKSLGVRDFHLRPVGYYNITKTRGKKLVYTPELLQKIEKQIAEAMKLENKNFHVYGVRHKFNPDFSVKKKNFSRCWIIPILPTFGADGNMYLCFDMIGRKNTIMCKHYPDVTELARFWNSNRHREMVKKYNIDTCPRCTFDAYNEMVEKVIINDGFCRNFP